MTTFTAQPTRPVVWPDEFAVHFWASDTRNHRYLRSQIEDTDRHTLSPNCTLSSFVIPNRWAFRSELSQELGPDRDTSRDCRTCFREARR